MEPKTIERLQAGAALVMLATAFAFGRYTVAVKTVTVTKTVEVEKKVTDIDAEQKKHTKTTVVETQSPDGAKTKTTTITQDTDSKKNTDIVDNTKKDETDIKTVTEAGSKVTISALGGVHINGLSSKLIYGVSVSKPILGPITAGAFVLSEPAAGVSLGLTF